MQDKFTPEEWNALRTTPQLVVLAMSTAGSSGIFGTIGEMLTAGRTIYEASTSANELIRAVSTRDEARAAQDSIKEEIKDAEPASVPQWLHDQSLLKVRQSLAILNLKAPEEKEAWAGWLRELAKKISESSTEGGFLGFGGERVSEKERAYAAALEEAVS
jgi:hypothetical protein